MRPLVLALMVLVSRAQCQLQDCAYPTVDNLAEIIYIHITEGTSSSTLVSVNLLNSKALCLSHSVVRDRYRHASVLTEYSCEGLSICHNSTFVEQFAIKCLDTTWNLLENSTNGSLSTLATFSNTTRENCGLCVPPEYAEISGLTADPVTHCVG